MGNHINQDFNTTNKLSGIIKTKNFSVLDKEMQRSIINNIVESEEKKHGAGFLGKFLGTNVQNAVIHVGFLICAALILIMAIDCVVACAKNRDINIELLKMIIPVITLYLGYIFGKNSKQNH